MNEWSIPGRPERPWDRDDIARGDVYMPGTRVRDYRRYLRRYAERSARARALLPWSGFSYGPDPAERLHFFPADRRDAPLHVFVHGGYWQELSEAESSFAALDMVPRGTAFAALGYGLAPRHKLTEIVAMVRRGILWLYRNAGRLGFRADRIYLSGSSAGAHLAAMCLLEGWLPAPLRPADVVHAVTLLSGIYELVPLCGTCIGAEIMLSRREAVRLSPVRYLQAGLPPLLVARGAAETQAFADQQDHLVTVVRRLGIPVDDLVVTSRNHFDLPLGLGDPDDALGRAELALMGLLPARDSA
jgi:arylformamidase